MTIDLDDYFITIESLCCFENHDIDGWVNSSKNPRKTERKLKKMRMYGGSFSANNYDATSTDCVSVPFLIKGDDGKWKIQVTEARIAQFFPSFPGFNESSKDEISQVIVKTEKVTPENSIDKEVKVKKQKRKTAKELEKENNNSESAKEKNEELKKAILAATLKNLDETLNTICEIKTDDEVDLDIPINRNKETPTKKKKHPITEIKEDKIKETISEETTEKDVNTEKENKNKETEKINDECVKRRSKTKEVTENDVNNSHNITIEFSEKENTNQKTEKIDEVSVKRKKSKKRVNEESVKVSENHIDASHNVTTENTVIPEKKKKKKSKVSFAGPLEIERIESHEISFQQFKEGIRDECNTSKQDAEEINEYIVKKDKKRKHSKENDETILSVQDSSHGQNGSEMNDSSHEKHKKRKQSNEMEEVVEVIQFKEKKKKSKKSGKNE